ncbi:MAG: stage 0 sporulation family protein [Lachnospiraceae bacterium]|nr:stage 0 sporulation family protein [Lachnospiraceae bacterium]
MEKCLGIRFRVSGKIYYFKPNNEEIDVGDACIVETIRGIEYGKVVKKDVIVDEKSLKSPLRTIIRKATEKDRETHLKNKEREGNAFAKCKERIIAHGLPMKLLDCEYTFDSTKILFYFSAESRIDFRELVKDLASIFRIRIELRQVGVRDETKILGGLGPCGREYCCATYLFDFKTVSIKNVKEQGVSLNPAKISGACGRLMCCLNNEKETYEKLNESMPQISDFVTTNDGMKGTVQSINTLRQKVKVLVNLKDGEKEMREYNPSDLKFKKRQAVFKTSEEEKEAMMLEELEKKDVKADL